MMSRIYPSRLLAIFSIIFLFFSCKKSDVKQELLSNGLSIIATDGHVAISGYRSFVGEVSTVYWLDGLKIDATTFIKNIPNGTFYRKAIDDKSRINFEYKNKSGAKESYQMDQGSFLLDTVMYYYKNNVKVKMNSDSVGVLRTMTMYNDKPLFAGMYGKVSGNFGGSSLAISKPFYWNGVSAPEELPLSSKGIFKEVTTIFQGSANTVYIGGNCGFPVYWKNKELVVLDERYGEVLQITQSNNDIYAVGLINKHQSNSTGHTACYWKNGVLHELEDNAQASGIFINGEDVYVTGSTGDVPVNYKPCYWKNGVRVNLPTS